MRDSFADRHDDPLLGELDRGAADIVQLVPALADRFPDLSTAAQGDPQQARFRLFDAIAVYLENAAAATPLLILLDDLHWADRSSLLLLRFVAPVLADARILVIAVYLDA